LPGHNLGTGAVISNRLNAAVFHWPVFNTAGVNCPIRDVASIDSATLTPRDVIVNSLIFFSTFFANPLF
jgi:hypothetical protein